MLDPQPFIQIKRDGTTRFVILLHKWAVKFPRFLYLLSWQPDNGLYGMLGNMREFRFGHRKTKFNGLAPAIFCAPLGMFLIMQRANPLTDKEWAELNPRAFARSINLRDLIEAKRSSFGTIDGKIVAVDYAG